MSYIDKNLLTNESVIFRTRKSLVIFFVPAIWLIITVSLLITTNPYIIKFAIIPGIIAFISWFNTSLLYSTAEFAVTNQRIVMKEGFFMRHINETRLTTVANITTDQSLIGQLFNYGTLFINVFGGETDCFTQISAPLKFKQCVQEQVSQLLR